MSSGTCTPTHITAHTNKHNVDLLYPHERKCVAFTQYVVHCCIVGTKALALLGHVAHDEDVGKTPGNQAKDGHAKEASQPAQR